MKTVAFLQNQWFKDPERAKKLLERYEKFVFTDGDGRERFLRDMLFLGCLTGKRLLAAFTWDVCAEIIWEEASRDIGGKSSSRFKADVSHIESVLRKHQPGAILIFGKVASDGFQAMGGLHSFLHIKEWKDKVQVCVGPHPAARGDTVVNDLANMATWLKGLTT